jgi:hypothetical protein
MAGWRAPTFAALLVLVSARPAAAQARSGNEIDLSRVFSGVPTAVERVLARGHTELFRLLENIEILRIESEIDRYVGKPTSAIRSSGRWSIR